MTRTLRPDGSRRQAPCFHCACGEDSEHVLVDHDTITARLCHGCFGAYLEANMPDSPHLGRYYTPAMVFDPDAGTGGFLAIVTNPPFGSRSHDPAR